MPEKKPAGDVKVRKMVFGNSEHAKEVKEQSNLRYRMPEESAADRRFRTALATFQALDDRMEDLQRAHLEPLAELVATHAVARSEAQAAYADREGTSQLDEFDFLIRQGAVIAPWLDPRRAVEVVTQSDALTSCILAMSKNVGGHGYDLVPTLAPDVLKQLSDDAKLEMDQEKIRLEAFFREVNPELSFVEIRSRTTADKESVGYAGWEILRSGKGDIAGIEPIPAWTLRLGPLSDYVDAQMPVRAPDGTWASITISRRFRNLCQIVNGRMIWFKTFGDPRFIDRRTGRSVDDPTDQKVVREMGFEAHEALFFKIYGVSCGTTPYGIPRWVGAVFSAIGRREAAEVNMTYFSNKAVPPLAVLVSGGQLSAESARQIEDHFRGGKGKDMYHEVIILEAVPATDGDDPSNPKGRTNTRVQLQPLTDAMNKDGIFGQYSKDAISDIRMTFGLPQIYIGLSEDYNRATAETAADLAEKQVFGPERNKEDDVINRQLLPAMKIRYWTFKTKAAHLVDQDALANLLDILLSHGSLTADEARVIGSRQLGHPLDPTGAPWASRPSMINQGLAAAGVDFTTNEQVTPPAPAVSDEDGSPDEEPGEEQDEDVQTAPKPAKPAAPPVPPAASGDKAKAGETGDNKQAEVDQAEASVNQVDDGSAPRAAQRDEPMVWVARVPQHMLDDAKTVNGFLRLREEYEAVIMDELAEVKTRRAARKAADAASAQALRAGLKR